MHAGPPTSARSPRLVLRFAVYSAITLALAWVAIFFVVRREAAQRAERNADAVVARLATRAAPLLRAGDFTSVVSPERHEKLDEIFKYELVGDLIRVKLWSREGVVTYSNDHDLIGGRSVEAGAAEELMLALQGQSVHDVAALNAEGGKGPPVKTLESWVPIYLPNQAEPAGALEVFQDYGPVAAEVRATITPIAVSLGLALTLLYAALLPILRQVTRTLEARHARLSEHAAALTHALGERREAERRLGLAERNYRSLVEQLPLVMYVTRLDESASCVYMSPQIEGLIGYTSRDCTSDPDFLEKVLHPDDREWVLAEHRRRYAAGESFTIEYRMIASDARVVWIHDEVSIARDTSGRLTHAQGFLLDVTERRVAQEGLVRGHAELAALHDTALLLIDELDAQRLLERIASRAGDLVGTGHTYVYLRDGDDHLRVAVGTGVFAGNVGHRLARGEGLAGRVFASGEPLVVDDYHSWEGRDRTFDATLYHTVVGVPLRSRTEVVGVLGVAHTEEGVGMGESEIPLLARFAHLASLALESARLYSSAQDEIAERRRAEEALRDAELRYRTLVEHLPLVTYIRPVDTAGGNLYASPQVETLLGYPVEEWLGNPGLLAEIVHPDDRDRVLAEGEHLRATGDPIRSEYRYVAADGRTVWVLDETILVRDEQGTPLWVQGFLLDITERRAAEETRARLSAIVEASDDAIMSVSLDGRFTSWNAGAERIFGRSLEEAIGRPVTDVMPPEREHVAVETVREVIEEGRAVRLETVILRQDGTEVDVAVSCSPIRDSGDRVVGLSAIAQDITQRKRAEAAILESESKFRSFVETTEEWVWASDAGAVTTYANPAIERVLGWRPDDMTGRSWLDFVLEEDREEAAALIAESASNGAGWSGVVMRWRARDGGIRYLESNATPILDETGELVGWRGTDRDVTHRIQAEAERERLLAAEHEARELAENAQRDLAAQNERLRELDRLKDEFIALVSHELRTPLTSIRGYTELLMEGEGGDLSDEQRQFLAVVERNAHRLLHLVGDLLFLAQVEAGKLVLEVGTLDLGSVASESVETARPQAEAKGVTLTLATDSVAPIAGDRARVSQLLDNLVSNAIKFTPDGGRVDVRVHGLDHAAVIEVRDSGIGIPEGEEQFLFQRFYRTSSATEQAIQGTGLGLAISKAIVEAHNGSISVESREGRGTTFRVALPLRQLTAFPENARVAL